VKWKKSAIALTVLTLIILSTLSMETSLVRAPTSPEGTVASTELINFYGMTTSEATTFVQLLQTQGIPLFIVRLNAFSEWRSGSSSGIAKAKQIIEIANSHGIEVAVDLHTWYTTWDSYFRDSASGCSTNRAKYIIYVKNVLNAFADSNVYAFMVMNEPQARKASNSESQFILDVIAAAKQVTNKPISVRFMAGYSATTGHYSAAIDQACDFICRNTYWDARNPGRTVYGATEQTLLSALNSAHSQDKRFWITEFGKTKSNLEEQRSYVEAFVSWAKSKGVDAVFCWVSQPDVSGENYNIFSGYTPSPAFYELTSGELPHDDKPPSPPPSPPPELDVSFEDNFESGNLDLWMGTGQTSGETVTITNSMAYDGTKSLYCTKTGTARYTENAYLYKNMSAEEAYANGYFWIDGSGMLTDEGDTVYFIRFSDGSQPLATAGIRQEDGIVKWVLYAGETYVTGSTVAVSRDRWYNIELHWDPVEGTAEMFVDGVSILEITVGYSYKINPRFVDIGIIAARNVQNELALYCDCFILSKTYIGPERSTAFPPWDTNQDGRIDLRDVIVVLRAFDDGSTPTSPNWNPRADVNFDKKVDGSDLQIVLAHYGQD
jgi:hypothetical protein